METERNALSEFAEELGVIHDVANRSCTHETKIAKVVRKAQRIVSELSKSAYRITVAKSPSGKEVLMYEPQDRMAVMSSVYDCRKIAEESDNGK